jgi:hypothetical protein
MQRLYGVWTNSTATGDEDDYWEFGDDGYLRTYDKGQRQGGSTIWGWHVSRGRLVITSGDPYRSKTILRRISQEAKAIGDRLELNYALSIDVKFDDSQRTMTLSADPDIMPKDVTFIRVGDAQPE